MLVRYGLVCPSFVAPPRLEELRRLTRLHARTRPVASTLRNMLHRMLDESGLRIGGILTDLFGLSGPQPAGRSGSGPGPRTDGGGCQGQRAQEDPGAARRVRVRARRRGQAAGRAAARHAGGGRAVVGGPGATHCRGGRAGLRAALDPAADAAGDGALAAAALLAEVGDDMEAFGTARRLASWAGICPGNHESAGKSKGGKRRKGNVYLRRILCEVAHAAARTHGVQFGSYKQQLAKRRGAGRAVMATAHKILRIVFAMLRDGKPYCDPQIDYQGRMAIKNKARWLNMLRKANLLQDVVSRKSGRAVTRRGGRRPRRAAVGDSRAASGLNRGGGRVHGKKRERRGKHAYRARRPPSSRA